MPGSFELAREALGLDQEQLARRLGVDLASVRGTGSAGRITDEDVERAAMGVFEAEGAAAVRAGVVEGEQPAPFGCAVVPLPAWPELSVLCSRA